MICLEMSLTSCSARSHSNAILSKRLSFFGLAIPSPPYYQRKRSTRKVGCTTGRLFAYTQLVAMDQTIQYGYFPLISLFFNEQLYSLIRLTSCIHAIILYQSIALSTSSLVTNSLELEKHVCTWHVVKGRHCGVQREECLCKVKTWRKR